LGNDLTYLYKRRGFKPFFMINIAIDRRAWPGFYAILLYGSILCMIFFGQYWLDIVLLILLSAQLLFFRIPKRRIPVTENPVAAADGKVVEISTVTEERFFKEETVKIGTFLSLLNAHMTLAPIAGKVRFLQYVPGKFINALKQKSVMYNESNWIALEQGDRRILIRQMSGAIARRICCDVKLDQAVQKGGQLGIICYGSRVEIYIPKRCFRPTIEVGQHMKAGETILGEWIQ